MRTKTLLTAAAALAVGLIASQTQAQVYSQNIVGYVSQKFSAGDYTMIAIPLQATNGNANAEDALTSVQAGDSILLWNGAGYDSYYYTGTPGSWLGPDGIGSAPSANAGTPMFYLNSQTVNETNIFVGTVATTNSATLVPGYTMVGSVVPIGGAIDSTNFNLPFQSGDSVLLYNGNGYDSYYYTGTPGSWLGPDGIGSAPSINVGEGFFYNNSQGSSEQWNQNFSVDNN